MTEHEITPEIIHVLRSMELFRGKDLDELIEWLSKPSIEGAAECRACEFPARHRIIAEGSLETRFSC